MPLDALGASLSCRRSPCANRPGRRAGRQVTFHVSPRPGQTPTSRPALGNYRPSPFPTGTPSFPHTVPRTWGSGSPNLSSVLLMQCLLSLPLSLGHTHTHTNCRNEPSKRVPPKLCKSQGTEQCTNERQLTLQVMHFNGFPWKCLYPAMEKKKKKSPNRFLQPGGAGPRDSSARGSAAQRLQPAQKPAARGRGSAGERRSRGACTSLSDKDRGFMINSGRFKYLLS